MGSKGGGGGRRLKYDLPDRHAQYTRGLESNFPKPPRIRYHSDGTYSMRIHGRWSHNWTLEDVRTLLTKQMETEVELARAIDLERLLLRLAAHQESLAKGEEK
jgi:hypothetical protein